MARDKIPSRYDEIWAATQQMLEAARKDDWDGLVALEKHRLAMVTALKGLDVATASGQERITETIRQILAADEEIKTLAESWMVELQGRLASVGNERKLFQAYNQP